MAKNLYFFKIGFAHAEPLGQEFKVFQTWLQSRRNASMKWIERKIEKREDVRNIIPAAKSVIVFAYNYKLDFQHRSDASFGKISRYKWGTDYHQLISNKLEKIISFIKELEPNSENIAYVDSGPVLEKAWAVRAGIGWQGKNSLILTEDYGSFFFLGLIISSLEFKYNNPMPNLCGKCSICTNLCPTQALNTPKILDANKCISYWTIETKARTNIPDEIAANQRNWIFGCDICQEVCPYNQRAKHFCSDPDFIDHEPIIELDINEIQNLNEDQYSTKFSDLPNKRFKLEILKRNASAINRITQ
ncbi:MAG: tRNA epoxyqueuosine(34) reductase QueG [Candidatus Kapabacteria bacterium]|nr:tRNA epoxyqueuosine(34) reductase QueG [Candidatus Kapabacteria bacterium]